MRPEASGAISSRHLGSSGSSVFFSRSESDPPAPTDFAYRSVADDFRLIESGMAPVIIARDEKARRAVAQLGIEAISSGTIARDLQSYIVQVPPKARARLIGDGRNWHVRFAHPELRGEQFAVLVTESLYTDEEGLLWDDAEYMALENSIL